MMKRATKAQLNAHDGLERGLRGKRPRLLAREFITGNPAFNQGVNWNEYVLASRAAFYTRLFAGLFATGLDPLIDLNCISTRENGFCFRPPEDGCCLLRRLGRTVVHFESTALVHLVER